jgi:hypothetical protein
MIVDFEDLSLQPESYWNGSDLSGGFAAGGAWFGNNYDTMYGSWDGFAYSNITDTASTGWDAQYNAITGGGYGASENYAIGFAGWMGPPTITFESAVMVAGFYVTNNNYTYDAILSGYGVAKAFGGASGDDEDWFMLTIAGKDSAGDVTGTVDFYLADYRFADNGLDYVLDDWAWVDLSRLGAVKSLEFGMSSTDNDPVWGMNTPGYFVMDSIVVPEPAGLVLLGLGAGFLRMKRKG